MSAITKRRPVGIEPFEAEAIEVWLAIGYRQIDISRGMGVPPLWVHRRTNGVAAKRMRELVCVKRQDGSA
jgi:hypothetical protein